MPAAGNTKGDAKRTTATGAPGLIWPFPLSFLFLVFVWDSHTPLVVRSSAFRVSGRTVTERICASGSFPLSVSPRPVSFRGRTPSPAHPPSRGLGLCVYVCVVFCLCVVSVQFSVWFESLSRCRVLFPCFWNPATPHSTLFGKRQSETQDT